MTSELISTASENRCTSACSDARTASNLAIGEIVTLVTLSLHIYGNTYQS